MVAESSSHDSATTENDGDGEILGETQGKRRDATWPVGVYILLLATELLNCERELFLLNWSATTQWLLSSFARTFPSCRWWLTSLDVGHMYDQREK